MRNVWFGEDVADDGDLRLCRDLTGKRAIELGVGPMPVGGVPNSVSFAEQGAKSIAVDPRPEAIASIREAADAAEVRVECHQGELADLGFATSGSVDLVLAACTLDDVDDLPRLLRQVHRVLRPDASFVLSLTHPVAAMFDDQTSAPARPYGDGVRSISELFMSCERSNFHIDVVHELGPVHVRRPLVPSLLVVRARKLGV